MPVYMLRGLRKFDRRLQQYGTYFRTFYMINGCTTDFYMSLTTILVFCFSRVSNIFYDFVDFINAVFLLRCHLNEFIKTPPITPPAKIQQNKRVHRPVRPPPPLSLSLLHISLESKIIN